MKRKESKCCQPLILIVMILLTSCEDMIEVDYPRTRLIKATVFEDDLTASAAVIGLYAALTGEVGGFEGVTYLTSLSSDEIMVETGINQVQFYENGIFATNEIVAVKWSQAYNGIGRANSIIEGLTNSGKISLPLKNQLMGEAKFFRAFHHFYLVNLYGDVPFISSTDYRINGLVFRDPVSDVYEKIIADLMEAKTLLSDNYSYSKDERVRVNKWAATSLLARVYLYREDWLHAEEQSTTVINNTSLFELSSEPSDVFLKNSSETIWQLIPTFPQKYTTEGAIFNRENYSAEVASMTDALFNDFEVNDKRKAQWVGTRTDATRTWHFPLKYKETFSDTLGPDEYYTVFRLAEQYLIRAEARAKQNKLIGVNSAESDINIIRNRAGLPNTTAASQPELLTAIEQERRVELFIEWGHRWLDLKRTDRATAVLGTLKPGWSDEDMLYPIPFSQLQLNPNLTQNNGY